MSSQQTYVADVAEEPCTYSVSGRSLTLTVDHSDNPFRDDEVISGTISENEIILIVPQEDWVMQFFRR